jgi:DUF438 domain-containing protein
MDKMNRVEMETGSLTAGELEKIFTWLPFEISFVGADDTVRFFSDKPADEKLFMRGKPSLGKDLHVCHPRKYIGLMEQILDDFKKGVESHARFWRQDHQGKFICIDYYAIRDAEGSYIGTLETVQDVTEIRKLEGDRNEVLYL